MTLAKIVLQSLLSDTASRENGAILRTNIIEKLQNNTLIEIDFSGAVLTPSFADEAFGKLNLHLTASQFNERIKFQNLSISQKALLSRVIANRFSPKQPQ